MYLLINFSTHRNNSHSFILTYLYVYLRTHLLTLRHIYLTLCYPSLHLSSTLKWTPSRYLSSTTVSTDSKRTWTGRIPTDVRPSLALWEPVFDGETTSEGRRARVGVRVRSVLSVLHEEPGRPTTKGGSYQTQGKTRLLSLPDHRDTSSSPTLLL